jgi:hypothetical protein
VASKIMQWVSITALLLAVSWCPAADYQPPLDVVLCAGAVMVVLVLFAVNGVNAHSQIGPGEAGRSVGKL